MTDAMVAEFDVLAGWTEEAIGALGCEYAVPAACRGSGDPDALRCTSGTAFARSVSSRCRPPPAAASAYSGCPT
jgi:hypothetical protein